MDIATEIAEIPRPYKTVPKESRPLRLMQKVEANMPIVRVCFQGFLKSESLFPSVTLLELC
jgi:hypothetical protein